MGERKPFTRGRQRDVISYFYENVGKDVTIHQLEKAFKGQYGREQLMITMNNLVNPRRSTDTGAQIPIVKVTQGVWRLEENKTATELPSIDTYGEPVQEDNGVYVKVRNGTLFVDNEPSDVDSFVNGLKLAVRIS